MADRRGLALALLLPGLASFVPSAGGYAYLARTLSSLIPVALVCGALIALLRRRAIAAAGALLGLTPIVWFTFGFMSPSAMAIGGGLALWTGLLVHQPRLTREVLTLGGHPAEALDVPLRVARFGLGLPAGRLPGHTVRPAKAARRW